MIESTRAHLFLATELAAKLEKQERVIRTMGALISRTTGKPIEAGRAVALACAALEAGLRPIGENHPL